MQQRLMRILVPYLKLEQRTDAAIIKHILGTEGNGNYSLEYLKTPADEPYAYWRELQARWGQGDDIMVIEQDIIINEQVMPAFVKCRHDWCTFAYPLYDKGEWMFWCLGCVRYSATVQEMHPVIPHTEWNRLDTAIRDMFWRSRIWPHCHGIVEHTHSE